MGDDSVARFYDELAADYHRIYGDWDSAVVRQGHALDAVIRSALGPGSATVLDCACGIGTASSAMRRVYRECSQAEAVAHLGHGTGHLAPRRPEPPDHAVAS